MLPELRIMSESSCVRHGAAHCDWTRIGRARIRACPSACLVAEAPRHPFLKNVIDAAVERIAAGDLANPFFIVGPGALGMAVNKMLGRDVSSRFQVGNQNIGGFFFRILRKIITPWLSGRRVVDGFRTIFMCHYKGYFDDLKQAGVSHWSTDRPSLASRLWLRWTKRGAMWAGWESLPFISVVFGSRACPGEGAVADASPKTLCALA